MKYLAAVLLLAACGDPAVEVELTLHERSTVELLPGGEVDFDWTVTGGDAELVVTVEPITLDNAERTIYDEAVVEGDGGFVWDGNDLDGEPVPPDVYDITATLFIDGDPGDSAVRNLSVHGVYFIDPGPLGMLTIAGSAVPVDIRYRTVSQRVIHLRTSLLPGDLLIDDRTIPGEFVPFTRDIHFNGVDTMAGAIPEGDYTVVVDVTDDDDPDLAYRSTGGLVRWLPND